MNKLHGLTKEQVEVSRQENGTNKIEGAKPKKFWKEWVANFEDPMLQLLVLIACVYGALAVLNYTDWSEPLCILGSLGIITLIATHNTMTSDKEYQKNQEANSHIEVKVYRNGQVEIIDSEDIVVGDLVILQTGDKILADGYMYDGLIKVDNSALNGESDEVKKIPLAQDTITEIDEREMTNEYVLLRGALVVDGEGVMKVTKVGMNTLVGEMAKEMSADEVDSPLKVKLADLAKKISLFGYIGAPVVGAAMLLNTILKMGFNEWVSQPIPLIIQSVLGALSVAITIVVMAVPEGLPLMIAIVLQQNTTKMLKHNVLVRKPIGIETAGSLNILFSDKTGTITKGKLEVVTFIDELGVEYKNINEMPNVLKEVVSDNLHINNSAMIVDNEVVGGNMTDRAMLNYVKDIKVNSFTTVQVETFSSAKKYMATQVQDDEGKTITFYKGAVERILDKCINVSPEAMELINNKVLEMANNSMRVLALGVSFSDIIEGEIPSDLILTGVVGIRDDVRPEAKQAIKDAHGAGVQVVMITGDRKETAVAIAKDCGLISLDKDLVTTLNEVREVGQLKLDKQVALSSQDLNELSDDEVKAIIPNLRVVSRALPTDKSRMVRLSQELGLVVGATGDGTNDGAMLKRADVGFSMGLGGTDAAKEASDIIIQDDNLKSIVNAIWYGRTIYNNILKFIMFQLTINVVAVFVCAIAPFFGINEPLTIIQLLLLNLVCDSLGAMALGGEPALKEYMLEKPKSRTQSIITKEMMTKILTMGAYMCTISMFYLFSSNIQEMFGEAHLTGYFALFVFMSIFNGFNVRSNDANVLKGLKDNPMFAKVMGAIIGIVVVLTFIGGSFLDVVPLNLMQWVFITLVSLTVIPIGALVKKLLK